MGDDDRNGFSGTNNKHSNKTIQQTKSKGKVAGTMSTEFRVRRGVRQGCVLSPTLFNIVAEMVMRETLEGYEGGVQIGGRRITNLRYADDIILKANTVEELQTLTRRLNEAGGNSVCR